MPTQVTIQDTTATPAPSPAEITAPAAVLVPSDSVEGLYYTVRLDGPCACGQQVRGLYHCSCPDHAHRARDCKHVKRAVGGEAVPRRSWATPAPSPALRDLAAALQV